MDTRDNIIQAVHFLVMRRVLQPNPPTPGIVDPGVNFDLCLKQTQEKVERDIALLNTVGQYEYFKQLSSDAVEWCKVHKTPAEFTEKVKHWARRV